jgi:15-hydroxyprostaglandin dehydrogenase (NAD)
MSNPVAIVTGGASDIGEAVTRHLISKGYKVAVADINTHDGEQLAKELGPKVIFHHIDVSKCAKQASLFKKVFKWGGNRLDFLAANAGVDDRQNLFDPLIELDSNGDQVPLDLTTIQVDLIAVIQGIWLFRNYVRQNKRPGGKDVIISSMAGFW